jgi:hypothetical protein
VAPRDASSSAVAAPIPRAPPVMSTRLSLTDASFEKLIQPTAHPFSQLPQH